MHFHMRYVWNPKNTFFEGHTPTHVDGKTIVEKHNVDVSIKVSKSTCKSIYTSSNPFLLSNDVREKLISHGDPNTLSYQHLVPYDQGALVPKYEEDMEVVGGSSFANSTLGKEFSNMPSLFIMKDGNCFPN